METLADRIARDGPLNELDAVGWAIRLAKHLEALHVHGVAHGSISPACVLVDGVERSAKAMLSDVRRTVESRPFHSPERIRDNNLSPADDTWALASTLYVLLTGQLPFSGEGDELSQRIMAGAPAPLAVYDVGDDDLQRIMNGALAANPAERLVQVSRLREALERWHPDPHVGKLAALEDDDVGDEHEAATAMLPQNAIYAFLEEATKSGEDGPEEMFAEPAFADPSAPAREEEDTVMRELPPHIMAMAARAVKGSNPPLAPSRPSRPEPPRPAPRPSADGPTTGVTRIDRDASAEGPPSAATHPTYPRAPMERPTAPEPFLQIDDDDDVSTVMHRPPEDDEGDEARTVMRDAPVVAMDDRGVPPGPPRPAAGVPAGAFPPPTGPYASQQPWSPAPSAAGMSFGEDPTRRGHPPQPPTRPMFDSSSVLGRAEQPPTRPQLAPPAGLSPSDFDSGPGSRGELEAPPSIPRSPHFDAIAAELSQLPAQREPPLSGSVDSMIAQSLGAQGTGRQAPGQSFGGDLSMGPASVGQGSMGQGSMGQGSMGQGSMGQGSMGQGSFPMGPDARGPFDYGPASQSGAISPDDMDEASTRSIYLVCFVALIVAAAVTYVLLRYRHQLGLPF